MHRVVWGWGGVGWGIDVAVWVGRGEVGVGMAVAGWGGEGHGGQAQHGRYERDREYITS